MLFLSKKIFLYVDRTVSAVVNIFTKRTRTSSKVSRMVKHLWALGCNDIPSLVNSTLLFLTGAERSRINVNGKNQRYKRTDSLHGKEIVLPALSGHYRTFSDYN